MKNGLFWKMVRKGGKMVLPETRSCCRKWWWATCMRRPYLVLQSLWWRLVVFKTNWKYLPWSHVATGGSRWPTETKLHRLQPILQHPNGDRQRPVECTTVSSYRLQTVSIATDHGTLLEKSNKKPSISPFSLSLPFSKPRFIYFLNIYSRCESH